MSRQEHLRSRAKVYSIHDPVPMEAAVLDRRSDSMREMVRQQVTAMMMGDRDAGLPDDDFLSDEEFDMENEYFENPISDYQLRELAQDLSSLDDQDRHEGSVAMSHPDMVAQDAAPGDQPRGDHATDESPSIPAPRELDEAPHST